MNLKLRFKNRATLLALLLCIAAFLYQVCGIVGIVLPVTQNDITQFIGIALNLLVALGVLVDPTTAGFSDSKMANSYGSPRMDYIDTQELEAELDEENMK